MERADAEKDHMGLTTWEDAPTGKVRKSDVTIAKNYLSEEELAQLSRMVSAYLDLAESMALRHIPMTMEDWETRLNGFLTLMDREVLADAVFKTVSIRVISTASFSLKRSPPQFQNSLNLKIIRNVNYLYSI
jgi:hypothetical protein